MGRGRDRQVWFLSMVRSTPIVRIEIRLAIRLGMRVVSMAQSRMIVPTVLLRNFPPIMRYIMPNTSRRFLGALLLGSSSSFLWVLIPNAAVAQSEPDTNTTPPNVAIIDGVGPDWVTLGKEDFQRANCDEATWTWDGTQVHCTGKPVGVLMSVKQYKNVEFVAQWRHLSSGGNSGFFLWTPPEALQDLPPDRLPNAGIEVQVLDHGYTEQYEKSTGKKGTWFTTNGDIFGVGRSKLKPFPPVSPDGSRSFPRSNRSKGTPEWNHYYVRAIQGEVRLWVNGIEVSGGRDANPNSGHLCLESEGAPVDFRDIRIRELP